MPKPLMPVGNTDFKADVDAVSGASLMFADDELMGNDQLIAEMIQDIMWRREALSYILL